MYITAKSCLVERSPCTSSGATDSITNAELAGRNDQNFREVPL